MSLTAINKLNSITLHQAIQIEADYKPRKKIWSKLAEEASEFTTKFLQWKNNPDKVSEEALLEEVADMWMNVETFIENFGREKFQLMLEIKTKKFLASKEFNKYKRIAELQNSDLQIEIHA